MKRLVHFLAAASLAIGGVVFLGCEEGNRPATTAGSTAGGNGVFGESADQPGQYGAPQKAQPSADVPPSADED